MELTDLKVVTYEVEAGVATITLNRPERLNAWTGRMEVEYRHAMVAAEADPGVRVIVVTGAGRGFCAGADMGALGGMAESGAYDTGISEPPPMPGEGGGPDFAHPHAFHLAVPKPIIAALNGAVAGVGFVLACYCDLRFAAAGAKITTSFGRLGLPAEWGVGWLLPRMIGTARAADVLFSSRVVLAEEAAELGLVNKVLPPDELLPVTLDYARTMAAEISPRSLAVMKRQLWGGLLAPLGPQLEEARVLMEDMIGGPDFAEGVAAFTERRLPNFPNP